VEAKRPRREGVVVVVVEEVASTQASASFQGVDMEGVKGVRREEPEVGVVVNPPPVGGEWGRRKGEYPTPTPTPPTPVSLRRGMAPAMGAGGGAGRCPHGVAAPPPPPPPPPVAAVGKVEGGAQEAVNVRARVGRYRYPGYSVPAGTKAVSCPPLGSVTV